jgi:voltage-gated potassium channel
MGYSNVIRSLIGEDATSGIIIEDIPQTYIGKTYQEYNQNLKSSGVLIGLLLNTGNFNQRRKDALREAQKNPNIQNIVDDLKKVKLLKSNDPVLVPPAGYIIPKNAKAIFVR